MRRTRTLVWQIFSASLLLLPLSAQAETEARYVALEGSLIVSGLTSEDTALLLENPSLLRLQHAATPEAPGMLVSMTNDEDGLRISPYFALRAGTTYVASIDWPEAAPFHIEFTIERAAAAPPSLSAFSPSQSVIPANTLRFYLTFSEPMARGQVRDRIGLVGEDGQTVPNPFLNLETELWDNDQKRLTLILDPGRIKQGVGPNTLAGAPLVDGKRYRLVVSGEMQSAKGAPLGSELSVALRVGPAERRAINPDAWDVMVPAAGTSAPFSLAFDRIMDGGAVQRLLRLEGPDGDTIDGKLHTDGGGWSLTPHSPWQEGIYHLTVDPELEDVAGNTIRAPFDAKPGTIGSKTPPVSIEVEMEGN
ncbi:hypothetical protein [Ruegeria sp. HKCCD8929]|uniref:hypothetical protein n=1 Tax=Ruegeria sp. HKCCD8929 TaxID=2683006 RepID=UPI0014882F4D|nr:hypothetical protein [Ruegeria sp. HKCCD8929]